MRLGFFIPLLFSAAGMALQAPAPPSVSPNDLVRRVITHELQAGNQDHSHWMYQVESRVPAPSKTVTVVETKNGNVTYLDDIDGHPLTPEQRSAEDQRVQRFINDPQQQNKSRREGDADSKKSAQLLSMLPDAFLFEYAGTTSDTGDSVKLTFHPNPNFTSHSSESFVFHKMDGFVIVNAKEDRLVEISGRLTHGVAFAGGLLGHLDPGGTFDVRREEVAPGHWAITRLKVDMNGKILFFKTISEKQDEIDSHFQRIPDATTMAQAEALAHKQSPGTPSGY
jgi:hypothetical protein